MAVGLRECFAMQSECDVFWTGWGAVISAALGLLTLAVAVAAWRTSRKATEIADTATRIAKLQHQAVIDSRNAEARIIGRLLLTEMTAMPARAHSILRALIGAIGWDQGAQIVNGGALEFALREARLSLLPSAEQVEARIHCLPDDIGADLATMIGASRAMNDIAGRIAAKVGPPARSAIGMKPLPTYAGSNADFRDLRDHIQQIVSNSPDVANRFRAFAGVGPADYDPSKGFDRPLGE